MEAHSLASHPVNLAAEFFLDDVPGASTPASRLRQILEAVAVGSPVSVLQSEFLLSQGFQALHGLVTHRLDKDGFVAEAKAQQSRRLGDVLLPDDGEARRLAVQEAVQSRNDVTEAKLATDKAKLDAETDAHNAPIFAALDRKRRRRNKTSEALSRFDIDYVRREHYQRIMRIATSVAAGDPIDKSDLMWLGSEGRDYWTGKLRQSHHKILAEADTQDWKRTGDPWNAVNACSHWRKAALPEKALQITEEALEQSRTPKIKSALSTTRGGAMRDLGRFEAAISLGKAAHELTPRDFRPCTLLGAVHIEAGAYGEGIAWYQKAEALGAHRDVIDQELRSIIGAAPPGERKRLTEFLRQQDADRYGHF